MGKSSSYKNRRLFKQEIPQMPEGYYSGDKPNPNLRKFVRDHQEENPYNSETDDYNVPAFDKPIETTKATAIYNMHTYWSKKPHDAIRQYIRHYTKPGDLVLDSFCGSGGTALAALMEGRKAIAIDRSPAATFITKNYCTPVDVDELQYAFEELEQKVKPEIDWLYETRCDRCQGKATTAYTVYSQVFQCPRCLEKIPLFDCEKIPGATKAGKAKTISVCPYCHARGFNEEISTRSEKFGSIPVLVSYLCENGCKPARAERRYNDPNSKKREYFQKYDLGKLQEIEQKQIPYWYPKDRMMHAPENQERWGLLWRPYLKGINKVSDFYSKRNLWTIASLIEKTLYLNLNKNIQDVLLFSISSHIYNLSLMRQYRPGTCIAKGTYYIPPVFLDENALKAIFSKANKIKGAFLDIKILCNKIIVSTDTSVNLEAIKTNSIDYIFTDPPYSWKIQFGESNFLWEAWLGFDTNWYDEEIIVNENRGKTETDWESMMKQAISECFRVLKPGRWISMCYHDTSEGTWSLVQDIMAEVGFISEISNTALFIETGQKAWKQIVSDKVTKRDLVINFRKPRPGELQTDLKITGEEDEISFNEKVHAFILEYLEKNSGATKDRIYDELVSNMLHTREMQAHDFDQLLRQVAEEVKTPVKKNLFENKEPDLFGTHAVSRWYLKETQFALQDEAESAKEEKAAAKIETFLAQQHQEHPEEEGVHYSDIFEHYIYAVKDKPRRNLSVWLPDYFFKTPTGTYRLPISDEEKKLKADGRSRGILRHIRRYLSWLDQGLQVPEEEKPNDASLAEWLRHCKRSGLYEQGKKLFEIGGLNPWNLSEEEQVLVEEDYQVCVRMLNRTGQTNPSHRKRKKPKEAAE